MESGKLKLKIKRKFQIQNEKHFKRKIPNPLFTRAVIGGNSTALPQQGKVVEGRACKGVCVRGVAVTEPTKLLAGRVLS